MSESILPDGALVNGTSTARPRALSRSRLQARSWLFAGGLALLTLFAFFLVWKVGHRGLFVLDESIVFDGAWRVLAGQVPYRDFVMPFGPVTFWLQALMFRWVGVDFSTLVLTAALLSVVATLASVRTVWLLTDGSARWSLLAGLLTATWYQAPFGIPWMEQVAFLFDLLSLLLLLEGKFRRRASAAFLAAAGASSALAILSKQNAGGMFVLVCLGCLCLPWRARFVETLRAVACYAAGGISVGLAFLAWLVLRSSPETFAHYWLSVSSSVGWERVAYWKILGTLTFQPLLGSACALFIATSIIGAVALWHAQRNLATEAERSLRIALTGWLCLSLPQFHAFFQLTTNNDAPNNNAFVGVCAACAGWLLAHSLRSTLVFQLRSDASAVELPLSRHAAWAALLALLSLSGYSVGEGITIAWTRNVQEFVGASFDETLALPRAARLQWGEPTRITPQFCAGLGESCKLSGEVAERERPSQFLRKRDLEDVATRLASRGGNFFVFPDTTILYGLLGRPSPQPLLYFHPGQSYALTDRARLDHQIVGSLRRNGVQTVVLERASFMGTHKILSDFPELDRWLAEDFRPAAEFGNYRVLERVVP